MRKYIIAGNWKMNKTFSETEEFFDELTEKIADKNLEGVEIIISPPALYLELACDYARDNNLAIAAQNVSKNEVGAFTGEISALMLKSMDLEYCIVGHSERRAYFNETDMMINSKIKILLNNEVRPIVCIGESKEQRDKNITEKVIIGQLDGAFKNIEMSEMITIAYEPIWAIGTGDTATPQQAQEVHKLIRNWIAEKYSNEIAEKIHLLYGGSMNPKNVENLLQQPDIDGGLIGGASLIVKKFEKMIDVAIELRK